jgi:hypothetical protein
LCCRSVHRREGGREGKKGEKEGRFDKKEGRNKK